jgi:hypothetical protein
MQRKEGGRPIVWGGRCTIIPFRQVASSCIDHLNGLQQVIHLSKSIVDVDFVHKTSSYVSAVAFMYVLESRIHLKQLIPASPTIPMLRFHLAGHMFMIMHIVMYGAT